MGTKNVEDIIVDLAEENPGYENLISQVVSLVTTFPPPFIYINDPINPRETFQVLKLLLHACSYLPSDQSPQIHLAFVNAVSCFTARIFYDTVLNTMAQFRPRWEDGGENWSDESDQRWNESVDGFVHGLRAVYAEGKSATTNGKGKGKQQEGEGEGIDREMDRRMVLVVERAERLKENLPDLLVPLTRLAELSQIPITVILLSDVRWQDLKPPLGASPSPYHIDISTLSKEATLSQLVLSFQRTSSQITSNDDPYNPALLPLYTHFASVLYSICAPFTRDPSELAYISAARWPGFAQPVLDDYRLSVQELRESGNDEDLALGPPTEDMRMRLTRLFTPSLTTALEMLYPRLTDASAWARDNAPGPNLLDLPPVQASSSLKLDVKPEAAAVADVLPRMSKFILIAAFLGSTNPAKTDIRMFGRGPDERKKRRGGGPRKGAGKNTVAKVPQRLLGPAPFPLDRLIAILGVLLEENDVETRPNAPQFTIPGEYTDMEVSRVQIYAAVMELTQNRLLHRTTPADRLDSPPMFKCGVSYDVALALARDVDVPLNDLMWDPA